ncbi:Na(+)/H(+) antiporter NhaA 2 [Actinocatenispora thailandica]|uniref:Na(+)/H(+) antiporter NhaA n=1 Tax=Actinocatenispora thailandica TaxID=227318 RepID=A0A7R7DKT6_9ACTN|nr:Na+/H+ antiporter NhaA [Actinocatenispora thailandica]BCJ33564.1 Na(+)/H(+) antiporter NhaA 2 [Actinocatenispora thailandica]
MTESGRWSARSAGVNRETALRSFLQTESGSATVLVIAAVAALVWANLDGAGYERFFGTELAVRFGDVGITQNVREWINGGLMALFFFVVGLEARREFDMGELRDRRRITLPLLAGLGGMAVPVLIYLAINAGQPSVHGWGTAMSTDTAFALGLLALVGRRLPDRVRAFLLTVLVVDDFVALAVITFFYSGHVTLVPVLVAIGTFGVLLVLRRLPIAGRIMGFVTVVLAVVVWGALRAANVEPVVAGLAVGLLTAAYPPASDDLERATGLFRSFREQPTPELARTAQAGLAAALSPNERLQQLFHPWTSYLIVPVFALANAGIAINGGFLATAYTSPITLGILFGYVLGKPVGILGVSWLANRISRGRLQPPVGWASIAGGGAIAGIGFTVSLLIATLAFRGEQLAEAKLGVLSAALCAAALSWAVFAVTGRLAPLPRSRALLGTGETLVDLAVPVADDRDHVRGPAVAPVTIVEYGDFECPYCGQAEPVVRDLLAGHAEIRYVWRHLPLRDVHPRAYLAAKASEAAAKQGAFWPMHDLLFDHQDELRPNDLLRYAETLGLDVEKFTADLRGRWVQSRVADDVESAQLSGVSGTPSFFINGRRHYGAYDIESLTTAVKTAKARALIRSIGEDAEPA